MFNKNTQFKCKVEPGVAGQAYNPSTLGNRRKEDQHWAANLFS